MQRTRSYRRKTLITILAAVFCCSLILGAVLYESSLRKLKDVDRSISYARLNAMVADLNEQYNSMQLATLRMSKDTEILEMLHNSNPYYELQALNQLKKYATTGVITDNLALYINGSDTVISSEFKKNSLKIYAQHYMSSLSTDELKQILSNMTSVRLVPLGSTNLLVFPAEFGEAHKARVVFSISNTKLAERAKLISGNMDGCLKLYFDGECFYTSSAPLSADGTEETSTTIVYQSERYGKFAAKYETASSSELVGADSFGRKMLGWTIVLSLLSLVVAVCVALYNYKPIHKLVRKYGMSGEGRDELKFFEHLLDSSFENESISQEKLKKQYDIMRGQLKRLILLGDAEHCRLAQSGFLNVLIPGPVYSAIALGAGSSEFEQLEIQIAQMSDESVKYTLLPQNEQGMYCALISYQDAEDISAALDNIRELCEAHGMTFIGYSQSYTDLTQTPQYFKNASEPIEHENEFREPLADSQAKRAVEVIDQNCCNTELTLVALEEKLGLSSRYISQLVHDETGLSYKEYLTRKRMETARRLLLETDDTVTVICEKSGYSHLSNFIKTFKQYYGDTPTAFRENSSTATHSAEEME